MLLVILACGSKPGTVDSDVCREWEEEVLVSVEEETSTCPAPSEIAPERAIRWQGCDGDEVREVVELISTAPAACSFLLTCEWACTYRARLESCEPEPERCWVI